MSTLEFTSALLSEINLMSEWRKRKERKRWADRARWWPHNAVSYMFYAKALKAVDVWVCVEDKVCEED